MGIFSILVGDAVGVFGRGVDEVPAVLIGNNKADVGIEPNDVDTFAKFIEVSQKGVIGAVGENANMGTSDDFSDEGFGRCLSHCSTVEVEPDVLNDGGHEVSAGDFSVSGLAGHTVEVPGSSEPAVHHVEESFFKEEARFTEDECLLGSVGGGEIFLGEFGAVLGNACFEGLVLLGVWLLF